MTDRLWFAMAAAAALLMIGVAALWPQGLGAQSPPPFGHPPIVRAIEPKAPQAPGAQTIGKLDLDGLSAARPAPPASSQPPDGLRPTP